MMFRRVSSSSSSSAVAATTSTTTSRAALLQHLPAAAASCRPAPQQQRPHRTSTNAADAAPSPSGRCCSTSLASPMASTSGPSDAPRQPGGSGSSSSGGGGGGGGGPRRVVVAIDGPAACGKGTLSKAVASAFNLAHLDTGLLYRAVGFGAVRRGIALDSEEQLVALCGELSAAELRDPGLRGDEAAQAASRVSVLPGVRTALGDYPRRFASDPPPGFQGAVLDGRDVGTVLCPGADVKLFLTASAEVRARRRLQELIARGMVQGGDVEAQEQVYRRVLQELEERDRRDTSRATAPLAAAPDAHLLDTSALSAEQVLEAAAGIIQAACPWLLQAQAAQAQAQVPVGGH